MGFGTVPASDLLKQKSGRDLAKCSDGLLETSPNEASLGGYDASPEQYSECSLDAVLNVRTPAVGASVDAFAKRKSLAGRFAVCGTSHVDPGNLSLSPLLRPLYGRRVDPHRRRWTRHVVSLGRCALERSDLSCGADRFVYPVRSGLRRSHPGSSHGTRTTRPP